MASANKDASSGSEANQFQDLPSDILKFLHGKADDAAHCENENKKLEEKKKKTEDVREEIEKEEAQMYSESEKLIQQLDHQAATLVELERSKANQCETQLQMMNAAVEEIDKIQEYKNNIASFERELEEQEKLLEELTEEQNKMKEAMDNVLAEQEKLRAEMTELEQKLVENKRLLSEAMEYRDQCEKEVEETRVLIESIAEKIRNNEKKMKDLNNDIRELETQKKDLEVKIDQLNGNIIKLEAVLRDKEARVARLQQEVDELNAKIKDLEKELEQLQQRITEINQEIEELSQKIEKNEGKVQELEREEKALKVERHQLEKQLHAQEDALTDRKNALNRLKQKIDAVQSLLNQVESKLNELSTQRENQKAAVETLESERTRLETLNSKQRIEAEKLGIKKEEAIQQRQSAENDYKKAEEDLAKARQNLRTAEIEREKTGNYEALIRAQLDRAIAEESQAKSEMMIAESQMRNKERGGLAVRVIGALIPIFAGICNGHQQNIERVRNEYTHAKEKYKSKTNKVSELRDKHLEAHNRTEEARMALTRATTDKDRAQLTATTKATACDTAKTKADSLAEKHRNAVRQQQYTEISYRVTSAKLSKAQATLNSTETEIQRYEQEKITHNNQIREMNNGAEDLKDDITRQWKVAEDQRKSLKEKENELSQRTLEFSNMKTQLLIQKGEWQNLKTTRGTLVNQEKARQREMTYSRELLEAEEKTIDQSKTAIREKYETLCDYKKGLIDVDKKLMAVKAERETLKEDKMKFQGDLDATKADLVKTEGKHREARTKFQTQSNKVESLSQNYSLTKQLHEQKQTGVKSIREISHQKNVQIDKRRVTCEGLVGQINAEKARHTQASKTIKTADERLTILKENVVEVDREIVAEEKVYNELKEKLNHIEGNRAKNDQDKVKNQNRIEKIQETMLELREYHGNLQNDHWQNIQRIAEAKFGQRQEQRRQNENTVQVQNLTTVSSNNPNLMTNEQKHKTKHRN